MSEQRSTTKAGNPARRAGIALALTAVLALAAVYVLKVDLYLWIKAFHIVAVVAWMAGMLYLPRLFVYHSDATVGSELSETLKVMEGRLLRIIINPAMAVTWILGLWMAWTQSFFTDTWFLLKFVLVFAMSGVHGYFSKSLRLFAKDERPGDARHWRIWNEVPTVLMIAIVILVIVKPF